MLRRTLAKRSFLVLDGGLATELEWRGFDLSDELWSARVLVDRAEAIARVHYDYFCAGADVAITATYQATPQGFARRGIHPWAVERLFHQAVRLADDARQACRRHLPKGEEKTLLVAAGIGPYGAFLADGSEYRGRYGLSQQQLMDFHRPRLELLVQAGPDCLAFETIPDRVEVEALLALLDEYPGQEAWLSFSTRDEARLADGTPIEVVTELIATHPSVVAVGVNCLPPQRVLPLLQRMRRVTDLPLVVYPNSGEEWDATRRCWCRPASEIDFGELAAAWYAAGARLIGGCCRTRPADVARMRRALEALVEKGG